MTANDQYKVALNIIARVGMNGDIIGEFSKAMSTINGLSSQEQMVNMQNMAQNTPTASPQPAGGTMSPEAGQSMPQDPNVLNQSPQPQTGGKYDNL